MIDTAKPQLLPGERVVWEGRPYAGFTFRPIEVFLIPFSLLWGGFALFWNVTALTTADLSFNLFGLPFLIAGLYITFGRFLVDISLRKNLAYFVTNKRILVERRSSGSNTKSLDIKRLPALELDERSDGSGTIRFGSSGGWFTGNNFGIWQPTFDPTPQFIRIPNVRSVYQTIQKQTES
ncbi:hypothetical protein C8J42_1274 [Sphingomonas sp. PP-CE-1A-559]|uniref:PH domain-containing protein n=1 Tax=Sphingomonas sp. PP-CE-1A-559 TaxID=2135657 RepID=UPI00105656EC|nr:PH domain-containing protein [Sphingomonas sp. PP-CE-1A-559]TCP82020.1 hypothetical protein C8J42_1274 [Sphingomonas sp. PP-CE-1A-559]